MERSDKLEPKEPVADADATSKETLGDLDEAEKSSASQAGESRVPSPDGADRKGEEGKV